MSGTQEMREGGPDRAALSRRSAAAAIALFAAAAIHAAEVLPHGREWLLAGIFFGALSVAQGLLGILVLTRPHPARWVGRAAIAVSFVAISAWVMSRMAGLPFGPHAGSPEAVGVRDLLASGLEVLAIAALLPRSEGARALRPLRVVAQAGLAITLLLAVTGLSGGAAHTPCVKMRDPSPIDYLDHTHSHAPEGHSSAATHACSEQPEIDVSTLSPAPVSRP